MDTESIMLGEISQIERQILCDLPYMWNSSPTPQKTKAIETENRLATARGGGVGGWRNGRGGSKSTQFHYKIN